jgi:hypothetical protein
MPRLGLGDGVAWPHISRKVQTVDDYAALLAWRIDLTEV